MSDHGPTRAQARQRLTTKTPCPLCTNWRGAGSPAGVAAALAGHLHTAHHITTPPNTPTITLNTTGARQ